MLKYFKKQKGRVRCNSSHNDDDSNVGKNGDSAEPSMTESLTGTTNSAKRNSLRSTSSFCDELLLSTEALTWEGEDDICAGSCGGSVSLYGNGTTADDDIFRYHSRLSMSLPAIVNEPNCLSYFVQYLELQNALPLLKFYLDTENFRTAALAQLDRQRELEQLTQTSVEREQHEVTKVPTAEQSKMEESNVARTELDAEDESEGEEKANSVPELKTLYALSMRKPLTDDEKSEIYAETSKQLANKCYNTNNNSNSTVNNCSNKLQASSELSLCSISTNTSATEPDCTGGNWHCISAASVNDAIAIYQKYLSAEAAQFVSLPVTILSQISLLLCKREEDTVTTTTELPSLHYVAPNCFDDAQQYILEQLERDYLNDFLQSTFYCRYCIELIDGANKQQLTIYDILYSETTLFFFMEFLEQRGERECLDFWTAAINFRKSYANAKDAEAEVQSDAMIIYEKFFSLQSDDRLWMSDKLRSRVEERICAAGHVAYCFDFPLQVTAKYLEKKYFDEFLKSALFETYVKELKTKLHDEFPATAQAIQNEEMATAVTGVKGYLQYNNSLRRANKCAGGSGVGRHRKTLSDCTNESSREYFKHISQHNTLLAMDTSTLPAHLKNLHSSGTNMNIDARQLTNPNLLWHRSTATEGGLKFGRINALGRYERDFESVDAVGGCHASGKHSWSLNLSGNKLKNAMRKLINLPEEKVQEEIAWQVAEMIVKDVTSITLNSDNNNGLGSGHK